MARTRRVVRSAGGGDVVSGETGIGGEVKMDEHQRLRDTRMFFQYATVREFCEPVERITGRTVRAFVSGLDM